ncbi:MAG: glycosyl hydrolase, partial [Chitinophagaceae bacterium]
TTLKYVQSDSWELGGINWTENFATEFKNRRGYDMIKYLPVIAGKIMDSRDISDRFLADLRKTIGDCISDNHYRVFNREAAKYGIGIQPESAGPHNGPFDGLKNFGNSDIMMGEFWSPSPHRPRPQDRFFVKQAASAAHIYNKPLVGAEAFTTIGRHWDDVIWEHMKPAFDHEVCSGLNLTLLHTYTSSPDEMGEPGQEYFAGTHFNRHSTWAKYSGAWFKYIARAQYMMQQGSFVGDVLYYHGDHIPNVDRLKEDDPAGVLPGFDYDVTDEDMLLKLTAKDGLIYLPYGRHYRLLVLPDHQVLSLKAMRKVYELVMNGATIAGPPTIRTASLMGFPASEQEVKKLSTALWGETPLTAATARNVGKGKVLTGYHKMNGTSLPEWLNENGLASDCSIEKAVDSTVYGYIHHTLNDEDYYFVSSQNKLSSKVVASFRVTGKIPERWDAVTGEITPVTNFTQSNGLISIPLEFDPYGSCFIVFRKKSGGATGAPNYRSYETVQTIDGPWKLHFNPRWGGPETVEFPQLTSWTTRPEEGIKYYSGSVMYDKEITVTGSLKNKYLELGSVKDVGIAKVKINGKVAGIVWAPPFRLNVGAYLKDGKNLLEIEVINSWRNRLVGDLKLSPDKRFTKTNITILPTWQLLESGLMGPVKLLEGN